MAARTGALPYYNSSGGDSSSIAVVAPSDFVEPTPACHLRQWLHGLQVARPLRRWPTVARGCAAIE
jgi:hypothetical protein